MNKHSSPALAHLRFGVTGCAVAVVLAAVVQMLVFAFVHFTDVRWEVVDHQPESQDLTVVTAEDTARPAGHSLSGDTPQQANAAKTDAPKFVGKRQFEAERIAAATDTGPVKVISRWDGILKNFGNLSATVGVIAALGLMFFATLGFVLSAGSAVPGIDKTASACTWAVVLGLLAVPWHDVMPSMPFAGLFAPYPNVIGASSKVLNDGASGLSIFTAFVGLPVATIASAVFVVLRFRDGVSRGIIAGSVSEAEELLAKEMRDIRDHPTSNMAGRSGAALAVTLGQRSAPRRDKPAPHDEVPPAPPSLKLRPTGTDGPAPDQGRRPI